MNQITKLDYPVKVNVKTKRLGEDGEYYDEDRMGYLYGNEELVKQYYYTITGNCYYVDSGSDVDVYEVIDINYSMDAEDFQYDKEKLKYVYVVYPDLNRIDYMSIESYFVDFFEPEVTIRYCGGSYFWEKGKDSTISKCIIFGFDKVPKELLENYLRDKGIIK